MCSLISMQSHKYKEQPMNDTEKQWPKITLYDWVPFFKEITTKLVEIGEQTPENRDRRMEELTRSIFEKGPILESKFLPVNPFSFIYTLASKNEVNDRKKFYDNAKKFLEVSSPVPTDDFFPTPNPVNTLVGNIPTDSTSVNEIWSIFTTVATASEPSKLTNEVFLKCLSKPQIGLANFSQCLFLINPDCYIPLDSQSSLSVLHKIHPERWPTVNNIQTEIKQGKYKFHDVLADIRNHFPGCKPWEINLFCYLHSSKGLKISGQFYQISSNVRGDKEDRIEDFRKNNGVWTGGPGRKRAYPLIQPKMGDIMLVRFGRTGGYAVGVVLDNEYRRADGYDENAMIKVNFICAFDEPAQLSSFAAFRGMSKANAGTRTAFLNTQAFKTTFDLIEKLTSNTNGGNPIIPEYDEIDTPLNRIFYGPPGTGKTYRTIDETLLILDPKFYKENETNRQQLRGRFEELRKEKRIEFVTFHQSFGYEEFVEGIRPLLGEDGQAQELLYEIKDGVFKHICSNAKKKKEPYVLIIDEINRGNISKIFGELITLVEESRRADNAEATTATLPYSGESFSVPANLYLIGTMNTADRSIALLDTALRRRFEFVEMMPDSTKLKGIVFEDLDIPALLTAINRRIEALYDRDHQIGHTYFLPLEKSPTIEKLASIFRNAVLPLLQEYFYDDWEKIDVVLNGNGFVTSDDMPEMRETVFVDRKKKIWRIGDSGIFEEITAYKKICKGNTDNKAPTDDNIE